MLAKPGTALLAAAQKILHPLVAILLRNGIDYGTFAEVLRKVYVDKAFSQLEQQGSRPTVSAASAMTGLTRKEAKRLSELEAPESAETLQRYNRAVRVISGWLNDARYCSERGEPRRLPVFGEKLSFESLVREFSGDIPVSTMLSVLQASGSIAVRDGEVSLSQRAYIPNADPVEKIAILGSDVAELVGTIGHNLACQPDEVRFQRKVSNADIPLAKLPAFQQYAADRAQTLLEELNRWLVDNEIDPDSDEDRHYVALGIYYTERAAETQTNHN